MHKRIAFLAIFVLLFIKAQASHLMGGEITWKCQGNGQYVFTMKLYRDCNGEDFTHFAMLSVFNNPALDSIPLSFFSKKDISPTCNSAGPSISCTKAETQPGWPSSTSSIQGAVQETVFKSLPITLNGVPPKNGWIFTYADCCRNGSVNNLLNPSAHGFTLRAVMYGYRGQDASSCFDSSPEFTESPSAVICVGAPFTYNHNASDPDLDSLSYSWAKPFHEIKTTYNPPVDPVEWTFMNGYSFDNPLPGKLQNPANIPVTLNAATGAIAFTSYTQGNFETAIKVESWKCGQLVSEVYREVQIILMACATNNKPVTTFTTYKDTVLAGELINFTLTGNDSDLLTNGKPQNVIINASGNQFGTGFTNSTAGCPHPPCATLSPVVPVSAATTASTTFNWQTSCNHISQNTACISKPNTYTFIFKVQDDFCPAPAQNISTVSITVLAVPVVPSPQPRCVSVLANGDVTINWSLPIDKKGTFNSYHIYTSNSTKGPFNLLDSIFVYSQNSYTHLGANGQKTPLYYYIQTRSGCEGREYASPIDTVNTIRLTAINPGNGTAVLTWNNIATLNIKSSTGIYKIYQEYPAGVWSLIGQTKQNKYIDSIQVCNALINYRVEVADTSGCTSVSSIAGGTFKNIVVPIIPVFDTLSVDNNNKALMSWNVNPSKDVGGYVVYKFISSAWIPIDTVKGITNISYNYGLSTAAAGSEQFRVAAYDTCGNISPMSEIYSTIFLKAVPDVCKRSVTLNWSAYPIIGNGLAGYKIYQSKTGIAGPYSFLATVPSTALTYTVTGLNPSTAYYYKVEAFDGAVLHTASSNRLASYSAIPLPPKYIYLRKVSVVAPNHVNVTCHIDTTSAALKYKIMRSLTNAVASYVQIGAVPASKSAPILYTDSKALTDKKSYYYKVINVDSCGFDGLETNIGRTMLLTISGNKRTMSNSLRWNDYEDWSGTVKSYNIYRGIDGKMDTSPIANIPFSNAGINNYEDDVSAILNGQGVFNYYIEAVEGMGNIFGFNETSLSNIAEAYQEPIVYIPNAFIPGGINTIFVPVTTFVELDEYQFDIYNRWGKKVFTTTNVEEGWDGTFHGIKCELGVYVYLIRLKSARGEYKDYKGTVTLLR
ncbi:MAG: gliding motility-associated C-terminal domain-containing protein [Bacteroidia bacterium]